MLQEGSGTRTTVRKQNINHRMIKQTKKNLEKQFENPTTMQNLLGPKHYKDLNKGLNHG